MFLKTNMCCLINYATDVTQRQDIRLKFTQRKQTDSFKTQEIGGSV